MTRKMIVNAVDPEEVRIAILRGRTLEDLDIETRGVEKNKGNIYKGVVMAVEPALNAAFINYGTDKQGFLTAHDVHPKYAEAEADGPNRSGKATGKPNGKIERLLRPKQTVLVQVSKDEVSQKGAVLTTFLSLAGRYLVLMPDAHGGGASRKIDDEEGRAEALLAAARLQVPDDMGVIVRTAGRDRTKLDLSRDLRMLLRLWENIQRSCAEAGAPALIFKEQDVIIRALRDYFSPDIDEIVVDSDEAYDRAAEYMNLVMPGHKSALRRYVEARPIFSYYRIEEQLEVVYAPKVLLPSGGSIVIESTEALVAVDVNSGRQKSQNQEETATQTNVEAAVEVARQLRLRDLGGIIVVDFIDMGQRKNQQRVERTLKEALRDDKARVKIGRISRNGTCEITRQRIRSALGASVFEACQVCGGVGHVLSAASQAIGIMRKLRDRAARGDLQAAKVRVPPEVANRLRTDFWSACQQLESRANIKLEVVADPSLRAGAEDFTFENDPNAQVMPLPEPNFGPAPLPAHAAIATDEEGDDELLWESLDDDDTTDASERDAPLHPRSRRDSPEEKTMDRGSKMRRRSRGRRHTGTGDSAGLEGGRGPGGLGETLSMPTYEWVDLRTLGQAGRRGDGLPTVGRAGGERRVAAEREPGRKGRGRASGDGAGGEGSEARNRRRPAASAREAASARRPPTSASQAAGPDDQDAKPGLFSRLFGWARRD